jgi:pyruvate/2-oxoglutarate dehydrogenase complex dihydrolipoamide acyltransferase (E2) component
MTTIATSALAVAPWLSSFLNALSVLFGADAEPLDEAAVLRLVEQARAGDRAARQRLYRQHVNRVFRTVRGLLRSDAEAGVFKGPVAEQKDMPLSNMRATIAKRLLEAKTQIPHFYLEIEVDAAPLLALRQTLNTELESRGVKLSVNDFV